MMPNFTRIVFTQSELSIRVVVLHSQFMFLTRPEPYANVVSIIPNIHARAFKLANVMNISDTDKLSYVRAG